MTAETPQRTERWLIVDDIPFRRAQPWLDPEPESTSVTTCEAAIQLLMKQPFEVISLDYRLGMFADGPTIRPLVGYLKLCAPAYRDTMRIHVHSNDEVNGPLIAQELAAVGYRVTIGRLD